MAVGLDEATMRAIHDLEAEVDHLTGTQISLQASLEATTGELERERDANERLARERDYFKSFGVEIATRLHVIAEGIAAVCKAAELAGYRPAAVASFRDASAETVDAAVEQLGKTFGANGGGENRQQEPAEKVAK